MLTYPQATDVDQVDDYHGTKVADPYRGLEEYSPDTNRWIEAQVRLTSSEMRRIPERSAIHRRLTDRWNYERYTVPVHEGGRYFFSKNDGLQNQAVLYASDSLTATPRVLLDPNTLSKDGTVALVSTSPSNDGRLLAYALAEAGSDWRTWHVRDVVSGQDLPDRVRWAKFSEASWVPDGKGFFYSRFDEPKTDEAFKGITKGHKIYFHTIGTSQDEDPLVLERRDRPEWYLYGHATDDGRYLIITADDGKVIENAIFFKDLRTPGQPIVELLNRFDARYTFVGNDGPTFWVWTDLDAPRGRLVAIDTRHPERERWRDVIHQTDDALQGVSLVGDRFFASYLKDARSVIRVHNLAGDLVRSVDLPGIGSVEGLSGRRTDRETFYGFASFTAPPTVFHYDVSTGVSSVFRAPKGDAGGSGFETTQVFYSSKDGTRVPMFVTARKGIALDSGHPTVLYGYGGFNVPVTPWYSPAIAAWLDMGGVYAVANIRGGSEYGEAWHQAGMKLTKQNCFDDFIAAAEWLIANKYTTTKKLAIRGASNGGLLVGAALTQRPDLFGAAVPAVGVMDMLRFQKFTVGWGWVGDYGSSDDAEEFKALLAYSPYHNLKKGTCYPPTLIVTADHDDRVYPAHSFKFAAAMQAAQGCDNPVLIRIETRAGHGMGKPTSKSIDEEADVLAFLVRWLGVKAS